MPPFKIVVRSYNRSDLIQERTLKFLAAQRDLDLAKNLYIVVHESEKELYERALQGFPKAGFIVKTVKGIHQSVLAAHRFFTPGERLVFMDDDIESLQYFNGALTKEARLDLDVFGRFAADAFRTLDDIGIPTCWSVSVVSNLMFKQGKPFKEFRPHHVCGPLWGGFNSETITTSQGHDEDRIRTARCIQDFGGVLIYNWLSATNWGTENPGGMAHERGGAEKQARIEKTRELCYHLWENDPLYRKYHFEPSFNENTGCWTTRLLPISTIRKLREFKHLKWSGFFQNEPDEEEASPIEDMFGV